MTLPSDVSTSAEEDHAATLFDLQPLDRVTALKRLLFSSDRDFLAEVNLTARLKRLDGFFRSEH